MPIMIDFGKNLIFTTCIITRLFVLMNSFVLHFHVFEASTVGLVAKIRCRHILFHLALFKLKTPEVMMLIVAVQTMQL